MKYISILILFLFATKSLAEDSWDNDWLNTDDNESLKYNSFENEWEFADDDDVLKYNTFENDWEYAK